MVGVVGVLHDAVEAKQRRQPLAVDGEAGSAEGRCAEGAAVDARVGFFQAGRIALERRGERQEVVGEGGRLRLHAVRVAGDYRSGVPPGQHQQRVAGREEGFVGREQRRPHPEAAERRADVLPAAPGVQP